MSWSINQVARMTGLTSRTLRHYHAIGLLEPAWTGEGGRRHYRADDLLRLQEILLLRELGLGLPAIAEVLAGQHQSDRIAILKQHLEQLKTERERYERLIRTVSRTIEKLEENNEMAPEDMFDGFENPYETEARQRWGDKAVDKSNARLRSLAKEDRELLTSGRGFAQVHSRLAELKAQDLTAEDEQVQQVIAEHYRIVSLTWTPNAEAYVGLGEMYLADERFRRNIGQGDDSLVKYLVAGMRVYAAENLSER